MIHDYSWAIIDFQICIAPARKTIRLNTIIYTCSLYESWWECSVSNTHVGVNSTPTDSTSDFGKVAPFWETLARLLYRHDK